MLKLTVKILKKFFNKICEKRSGQQIKAFEKASTNNNYRTCLLRYSFCNRAGGAFLAGMNGY